MVGRIWLLRRAANEFETLHGNFSVVYEMCKQEKEKKVQFEQKYGLGAYSSVHKVLLKASAAEHLAPQTFSKLGPCRPVSYHSIKIDHDMGNIGSDGI